MKKNLLTVGAVLAAANLVTAAPAPMPAPQLKPPRPEQLNPQKPAVKPAPVKPAPVKPAPVKPAPMPPAPAKPAVKPIPVKPAPLPPPQTVEYRPVRNTYTIQLNANRTITFEQRLVGMPELRDKIRMVKFDRPRPAIVVRVEAGVEKARLDLTIRELNAAGFNDVKVITIPARHKFAPTPRIPGKHIKR